MSLAGGNGDVREYLLDEQNTSAASLTASPQQHHTHFIFTDQVI